MRQSETGFTSETVYLACRQIRDRPPASERLDDLAQGQLETMAQIGNYDWKLPLILETSVSAYRGTPETYVAFWN